MAAKGGRIDFMFLGPPPLPGRWIRYCVYKIREFEGKCRLDRKFTFHLNHLMQPFDTLQKYQIRGLVLHELIALKPYHQGNLLASFSDSSKYNHR